MSKPKVFVVDPYHESAVDALRATSSIETVESDDPRVSQWREEADGIIIRSKTRITAVDLDKVKKLKVIVKQGVGVDNIDLDAAKARGIAVCNTPAMNSEAVAELTITMALCVARRVTELDRRIRTGESVLRDNVLGISLFQKTIGVVGMGNIGRAVAQKWIAAMDGKVIGYDPVIPADAWNDMEHQRADTLNELLKDADVISLHVPLTDSTRNMIDRPQFEKMKRKTILVNCARGGIVNEDALLEALSTRRLFGAALDAMNVEPPTTKEYSELLKYENVIMTPHIGANTEENQINSGKKVAETVVAVLEGKEVASRLV